MESRKTEEELQKIIKRVTLHYLRNEVIDNHLTSSEGMAVISGVAYMVLKANHFANGISMDTLVDTFKYSLDHYRKQDIENVSCHGELRN